MGGIAIADGIDVAVAADGEVTALEEVLGEVSKAEAAAMEQIWLCTTAVDIFVIAVQSMPKQ